MPMPILGSEDILNAYLTFSPCHVLCLLTFYLLNGVVDGCATPSQTP
jgi:hypothetical protein